MLRAKPGLTFSLATGVARHRETPGALEKNDPRSGEAILPTGNLSFTRTVKWKRSRMGHHRPTSLLTILFGIGVRGEGNNGRNGMSGHLGGSCEAANLSSKYAVGARPPSEVTPLAETSQGDPLCGAAVARKCMYHKRL